MQDERSGERAPAKGGTTDVVAPDTVDSDASTTDPASDGTVSDGTASDDTTGDEPSEVADQETPANPDATTCCPQLNNRNGSAFENTAIASTNSTHPGMACPR